MDKRKIILGLIKKEAKISVNLSRKEKYNILITYIHNENYSFTWRGSTKDKDKKEFESRLQAGYDNICNAVFGIFEE